MVWIIEFLIFSFLGWIVDSTYRSLGHGKILFSGYFKGVPLCPIYGFGGILLVESFAYLSDQPGWISIIITTVLVTAVEYIGGWISEHFLGEKLWDYSHEPFNLQGYISAWHSLLWLIAVAVIYTYIGHHSGELQSLLNSYVVINRHLDTMILFLAVGAGLWLTAVNKKLRLSRR